MLAMLSRFFRLTNSNKKKYIYIYIYIYVTEFVHNTFAYKLMNQRVL